MREVVIISAVRTPVGKFLGGLSTLPATELGARVVSEAVRRARVSPAEVDEVIMGNVVSAGLGQNPARQAALNGGLPPSVAALTINKVCGSGLKAVVLASQEIAMGDMEIVVAGGMESMSNAPYLLPKARLGYRMGDGKLVDSMIQDGLWCPFNDFHMGYTGEIVAEKYGISREEQDRYALSSHQKAIVAIDGKKFEREILPIEVPQRKGEPILFATDEAPRRDTSLEALAKLRPVFKKGGTVTAGNAPGVDDGAAAVVITSKEKAEALGAKPLARIVGYAVSGIEPELVMMAPVKAVEKLWQRTGWSKEEVELFELNEAFSVQAIAVIRELKLDATKVNVHGGAVALGHPIGATGARMLTTLLYAMEERKATRGVAALCLGGGNAVAMAVERL
ncbi:acetyl-CoA acetyltransferase [bacterium (candidate division B38) B3_B38]|nr:MAG: acetyl-CoA acetyltransferase [bacterium (candidate division B38) B3_B38]